MFKKNICLAAILTLISFVGCGGNGDGGSNDESSSAINAQDLKLEHFDIKYSKLPKEIFLEELNSNDDFFQNFHDNESGNFDEACVNNVLSTYTYDLNADGTYNLNLPLVEVGQCYHNPSIENKKTFYSFYDESIKALDSSGTPIDLEGVAFTYDSNFTKSQSRSLMTQNLSGNYNGRHVEAQFFRAITDKNDFNLICVRESPMECTIRTVLTNEYKDMPLLNSYFSHTLQLNTTFEDRNSTYFSGGTITFQINDWNGTMTYTDPETPPTFTASNGIENASGTFNYKK